MKKSVVVMDNCSIHHDDDIREVIEVECGMYKYDLVVILFTFLQARG